MKKLLPLLLLLAAVAGVYMYSRSDKSTTVPQLAGVGSTPAASTNQGSAHPEPIHPGPGAPATTTATADEEEDEEQIAEIKPAADVFKSADEAFNAVKEGAKDYDDTILEQVTQPGDDCTWCSQFYGMITDALASQDSTSDQKSYYSEILAISGKVDNVKTLVDKVQNAKSTEEADLYAEALELTVGKDDVTQYLGDQLDSKNQTLREAGVAAITNQGTRLAAELLIKNTIERGDPDGYYSIGIGLGEMVPDDEAIATIQQFVEKRDKYANLGVKALVNSGMNGLRILFDLLETSKDPEADRKILLKDIMDHINYDDTLEPFLQERKSNTKQPLVREFSQQIQDEFANQNQGESEAESTSPQ